MDIERQSISMQKGTTAELRRANIKAVLEFIYRRQRTSKTEIIQELSISRPTVNQIVSGLMERELVQRTGHLDSTGGRKADALLFNARAHVAIGVELLKESYEIVAIDLYGVIIRSEKNTLLFENNDKYIGCVCQSIQRFIRELPIKSDQILGVNIVLQGLISSDGSLVTYGKILNCTGLSIQSCKPYLPYPCGMVHDGEAAATVELWFAPDIINAIFFHIRSNMSGALIIDGRFLKGNELKSGVFEHMTIAPNGRRCYCGKRGCVETYCSLQALLQQGETEQGFFDALRKGGANEMQRWDHYLAHLATAIDNLHMMMDYDVILGGILGRYLIPADIATLHRLVMSDTAFPTMRKFIRISESAAIPIATGAALPFVISFLDF